MHIKKYNGYYNSIGYKTTEPIFNIIFIECFKSLKDLNITFIEYIKLAKDLN